MTGFFLILLLFNVFFLCTTFMHYYDNLISMLNYSIEKKFGQENYKDTYKIFDNIEDLLTYIENYKS